MHEHDLQYVGYIGMIGPVDYGHSQLQYVEQYILTPELLCGSLNVFFNIMSTYHEMDGSWIVWKMKIKERRSPAKLHR